MNKERLESLIIDYIDGNLSVEDKELVERELASNPEAARLHTELVEVMGLMDKSSTLKPTGNLSKNFDAILTDESKKGRQMFLQPAFYRVAAAVALLILGAGVGYIVSKTQQENERLAVIERELQQNKQMMMQMMNNELSASQRLKGVTVAMSMSQPDDQIVSALVDAMHTDKNSNVRLAALDALAQLSNDPKVRQILIESLSIQNDPVVQIKLIQLLVQMKEKSVVDELKQMVEDDETMKAVKDQAYTGILRLS